MEDSAEGAKLGGPAVEEMLGGFLAEVAGYLLRGRN